MLGITKNWHILYLFSLQVCTICCLGDNCNNKSLLMKGDAMSLKSALLTTLLVFPSVTARCLWAAHNYFWCCLHRNYYCSRFERDSHGINIYICLLIILPTSKGTKTKVVRPWKVWLQWSVLKQTCEFTCNGLKGLFLI